MKRRCGRALLFALLVTILFFYPMLAPPVHRIDSDHYALIRNGMSLDEVELILGVPAGRYDWALPKSPTVLFAELLDSGTTFVRMADTDKVGTLGLMVVDYGRQVSWISRHGAGTIWFDDHWRVTGKSGWGETITEAPWHNWRKWFK